MSTPSVEIEPAVETSPDYKFDSLERFRPEVETIVTFSAELTITNDDEAENVTEVVSAISKKKKEVKAERMEITRPLDEEKKAAIAVENEILDPLEPLDKTLRKGLADYHVKKEKEAQAERDRIEAARVAEEKKAEEEARAAEREAKRLEYEAGRRKTPEAQERNEERAEESHQAAELARLQEVVAQQSPTDQVVAPGPVRTASGSSSVSMVWQATVTDESLIPREYLAVDMKAINAAMREGTDGERCSILIPGVEFNRVPRVSVT